jgi:hypothetical protein
MRIPGPLHLFLVCTLSALAYSSKVGLLTAAAQEESVPMFSKLLLPVVPFGIPIGKHALSLTIVVELSNRQLAH